jgi:hypothetical protein
VKPAEADGRVQGDRPEKLGRAHFIIRTHFPEPDGGGVALELAVELGADVGLAVGEAVGPHDHGPAVGRAGVGRAGLEERRIRPDGELSGDRE